MSVREYYLQALKEKDYVADEAQSKAIDRLQQAENDWHTYLASQRNVFKKLFQKTEAPRGVYMWGGVGRGKSFLMDSFYNSVQVEKKIRLHFHEFMHEVHVQLDALKGVENPLDEVAKRVAQKYQLICFDEFHVSDIADAMILYNLLKGLYDRQVSFIMTSNYEPDTLYPDGLHRDRILPALALLKQKMDVLNVDAGIDYRHRTLEQVSMYYTPIDANTNTALNTLFDQLTTSPNEENTFKVFTRDFHAKRRAGNVIWFDFKELCEEPRSQDDYLELAKHYEYVIVSDIPKMTAGMSFAARRFTWLIDVFYDQKVKLVMSAEVVADDLYREGAMSNEFHRTVSRIVEMQSKEYVESKVRDTRKTLY